MTEQHKGAAARTFVSQLMKQATLRGSINSTVKNTLRGASAITVASESLKTGTRHALAAGRVETFEAAMARLGIVDDELALIHNQILLQVYMSFVVGLIALLVGIKFFAAYKFAPSMLSIAISGAAVATFAQGSIRCFQIQRRALGSAKEWLVSFGDWLPSRMPDMRRMQRRDPLQNPEVVRVLVQRFRANSRASGLAFAIGISSALWQPAGLPSAWWATALFVGAAMFFNAIRYSFEVFRRQEGIYCDLLLWIETPRAWIPKEAQLTSSSNDHPR